MKKLFMILCLCLLGLTLSCGTSDKYIKTDAFQWTVELKNGDVASGTAGNEQEANKQINRFSKSNKSAIKRKDIKIVKVKTKRSKL